MFSQGDEEHWIERHFGHQLGRFLDLGAYDGIANSNTRALALAGWDGLCVEASPHAFEALEGTYRGAAVHCLHAAVTPDHTGDVTLYESVDQVSSISPEHVKRWTYGSHSTFSPIVVPALSAADLIARVGYDWDLVSLDLEGVTARVCLAFPWDHLPRVRFVVVEYDDAADEIQRHLGLHGFRFVGLNGNNLGMAR